MTGAREAEDEVRVAVERFAAEYLGDARRSPDAAEVHRIATDLGLWAVELDAEYSGAELGRADLHAVVETIGRHDPSFALVVAQHNGLLIETLRRIPRDAVLEACLLDFALGRRVGAWLGDLGGGQATLQLAKEGRLSGTFRHVLGPDRSHVFVTVASSGSSDLVCVIPHDAAGVAVQPTTPPLGFERARWGTVTLDRVHPQSLVHLSPGKLHVIGRGYDGILARLALAVGRGALERAFMYAASRKQFGRPIASFQAIQWMVADAWTALAAARALVDASVVDTARGLDARRLASLVAVDACDVALQLHGGAGYARDLPIEARLRDALALRDRMLLGEVAAPRRRPTAEGRSG